jgi:hypothetical protein
MVHWWVLVHFGQNMYDCPFDLNPLTRMRHLVTEFHMLVCSFSKYVKLIKLIMMLVVGSVENEKCFFTLIFMKSKLHNMLIAHLSLVLLRVDLYMTRKDQVFIADVMVIDST